MNMQPLVLLDELKGLGKRSSEGNRLFQVNNFVERLSACDEPLPSACVWLTAGLESGSSDVLHAVLSKGVELPPIPTLSFSALSLWSKVFAQNFLFSDHGDVSQLGLDVANVLFEFGARCTPEDLDKDVRTIERYFGVDAPPDHYINPLSSLVIFSFQKMQKDWDDRLWDTTLHPLAELLFFSGCDPRPAYDFAKRNSLGASVLEDLEHWSTCWQRNDIEFAVEQAGSSSTEARQKRM